MSVIADLHPITRLLQPRSVAVIGASADPGKTAGRPVAYLQKHGFAGAIYPVNPKVERIGGLKCYPDIASLPGTPDVAIVLLGAERAHLALRELSSRGCAAAIVLASGYSETGHEGARRQQQLREAAGRMRILGPNTIGLVNLTDAIVLSASGALEMDEFPVGGIGVVEGNSGVMRAGIAWQSLHDGESLVHEPLRLAVCIEAPTAAISDILRRHDGVRALFENHWLHLLALDDQGQIASRYGKDGVWSPAFTPATR